MMENELECESPYDSFVFGIRSPVTREKFLWLSNWIKQESPKENSLVNRQDAARVQYHTALMQKRITKDVKD